MNIESEMLDIRERLTAVVGHAITAGLLRGVTAQTEPYRQVNIARHQPAYIEVQERVAEDKDESRSAQVEDLAMSELMHFAAVSVSEIHRRSDHRT